MTKPQGTLLYASLGHGQHVQEAVVSILSALSYSSVRHKAVGIKVYADDVRPFQNLPVELIPIAEDQAREWRGPSDYVYNVKIQALLTTLKSTTGPVALLDGDTYFLRDPVRLMERISPGRAVMHVRECSLGQIKEEEQLASRDGLYGHTYTSRRGDVLPLGQGMPCWNSGVVGVHPTDTSLVEEVAELTAYLKQLSGSRISEQLAFGLLLERYTKLCECRDLIFHYWFYPTRRDFSRKFPEVLPPLAELPPTERWASLFPHRPHYSRKYRLKRWVRTQVLAPAGLRKRDYPMS